MQAIYAEIQSSHQAPFTLILENEKMETVSKTDYQTFAEARSNASGFYTIKDAAGVRIEARW